MVTLAVIEAKVEVGEAFYLQQIQLMTDDLRRCGDSSRTALITCLNRLLRALNWDIADEVNDDTTQDLYQKLSVAISPYSGASLPFDPNAYIPGSTIIVAPGRILQTPIVYPGDGVTTYTFSELIGKEALTVYRGTGTTLRAHASGPDDVYAQFNDITGEITVYWPFGTGESLWVEYRST